MADLVLSETPGTLLPLWALATSSETGGVAAHSELNLLRKSGYFSRPLALTGISLQSLSNWKEAEVISKSQGAQLDAPGLVQEWLGRKGEARAAALAGGRGPCR